ncbi:pyridoxamine 5'-phosphate oxidase [Pleionea sediminis]|uniref:pyridoxamine 5'-phosphate oxidase n=1 Tax=Pleionea sediminis TaxID=2569479 RepID=UPI0011864BD9|nr:pyridoxamine 5'-phosphate oxidase [Pleionea sediminis]
MNIQEAPKNTPFPLFENWFAEAKKHDPDYYNGMTIATTNAENKPSNRVVLLKEFDEQGFVFYTNYNSRKGIELKHAPYISANFWWSHFQRQIRIEGTVEKISEEQSTRYFLSRPRGSQLAAIASAQSQPIESFAALEKQYQDTVKKFDDKTLEKPAHWGGYRIIPDYIEFWQGLEHRLHYRLIYRRTDSGWATEYLQP